MSSSKTLPSHDHETAGASTPATPPIPAAKTQQSTVTVTTAAAPLPWPGYTMQRGPKDITGARKLLAILERWPNSRVIDTGRISNWFHRYYVVFDDSHGVQIPGGYSVDGRAVQMVWTFPPGSRAPSARGYNPARFTPAKQVAHVGRKGNITHLVPERPQPVCEACLAEERAKAEGRVIDAHAQLSPQKVRRLKQERWRARQIARKAEHQRQLAAAQRTRIEQTPSRMVH